MTDALTLYSNPMSRGRIVRWMLEEVGAPYEVRYLEYGAMKGADYLAINPMGKVPALVHGDVVVTEVAAICAYIADRFPDAGLAPPPGDRGRGDYYRWLFFGAGPIEAAVTNHALGVEVPEAKRGMVGYGSFSTVLDTLEQVLLDGREQLVGGRFSAADVYVGSQIGFGLRFGSIEDRPAFRRYWEGLSQRPAAIRAAALDDAALPARN